MSKFSRVFLLWNCLTSLTCFLVVVSSDNVTMETVQLWDCHDVSEEEEGGSGCIHVNQTTSVTSKTPLYILTLLPYPGELSVRVHIHVCLFIKW